MRLRNGIKSLTATPIAVYLRTKAVLRGALSVKLAPFFERAHFLPGPCAEASGRVLLLLDAHPIAPGIGVPAFQRMHRANSWLRRAFDSTGFCLQRERGSGVGAALKSK